MSWVPPHKRKGGIKPKYKKLTDIQFGDILQYSDADAFMHYIKSTKTGIYHGSRRYGRAPISNTTKWLQQIKNISRGINGTAAFAAIKDSKGRQFVIKSPIADEACTGGPYECVDSLEHEYLMGLLMNDTRKMGVPNVPLTLGYFWSHHNPVTDLPDVLTPYLVTELVNGVRLGDDFDNALFDVEIAFQILLFIAFMEEHMAVQHNDLHANNILIIKNETKATFKYRVNHKTYTIQPTYIPMFIDWGRATVSGDEHDRLMKLSRKVGLKPKKNSNSSRHTNISFHKKRFVNAFGQTSLSAIDLLEKIRPVINLSTPFSMPYGAKNAKMEVEVSYSDSQATIANTHQSEPSDPENTERNKKL